MLEFQLSATESKRNIRKIMGKWASRKLGGVPAIDFGVGTEGVLFSSHFPFLVGYPLSEMRFVRFPLTPKVDEFENKSLRN
jgi:hypothetical protein